MQHHRWSNSPNDSDRSSVRQVSEVRAIVRVSHFAWSSDRSAALSSCPAGRIAATEGRRFPGRRLTCCSREIAHLGIFGAVQRESDLTRGGMPSTVRKRTGRGWPFRRKALVRLCVRKVQPHRNWPLHSFCSVEDRIRTGAEPTLRDAELPPSCFGGQPVAHFPKSLASLEGGQDIRGGRSPA